MHGLLMSPLHVHAPFCGHTLIYIRYTIENNVSKISYLSGIRRERVDFGYSKIASRGFLPSSKTHFYAYLFLCLRLSPATSTRELHLAPAPLTRRVIFSHPHALRVGM